MEEPYTQDDKIMHTARLLKGIDADGLNSAARLAASEVNVPEYLNPEIRTLAPTELVLWSDAPKQVIDEFVRQKLKPLYDNDGRGRPIGVYATILLQDHSGTLTGEISFKPNENYRRNIYQDFIDAYY